MEKTWGDFYKKTENIPPRKRLLEASSLIKPGTALDIGAGSLGDSKFLAGKGFKVIALDNSPGFIHFEHGAHDNMQIINMDIREYSLIPDSINLINAQNVLSFLKQEEVNKLVESIYNALKSGGIFTGNFFGKNDAWNLPGSVKTYYSPEQVKDLLVKFEIITFNNFEYDGTSFEKPKHWHIIDFIAKKP